MRIALPILLLLALAAPGLASGDATTRADPDR